MILVAWTRCLPMAAGGSLTNNIAFFLFYIGVAVAMIIMPFAAYNALWSSRKNS